MIGMVEEILRITAVAVAVLVLLPLWVVAAAIGGFR